MGKTIYKSATDGLGRTFAPGDEVVINKRGAVGKVHGTIKTAAWWRPDVHHVIDQGLIVSGGWYVELITKAGNYIYWKQGEDGGEITHG